MHAVTSQLLTDRRVDDTTFAEGRVLLGETGMVELATLVGYYCLISMVLNLFEVPLPGDAPAWPSDDRGVPSTWHVSTIVSASPTTARLPHLSATASRFELDQAVESSAHIAREHVSPRCRDASRTRGVRCGCA